MTRREGDRLCQCFKPLTTATYCKYRTTPHTYAPACSTPCLPQLSYLILVSATLKCSLIASACCTVVYTHKQRFKGLTIWRCVSSALIHWQLSILIAQLSVAHILARSFPAQTVTYSTKHDVLWRRPYVRQSPVIWTLRCFICSSIHISCLLTSDSRNLMHLLSLLIALQGDWAAFEAKMKDANCSEAAIGAFKRNYDQLVAGVTGLVRLWHSLPYSSSQTQQCCTCT